MTTEILRYDRLVEDALRGVARESLQQAAENGLPGDHHFYITFRTNFPGVVVPDALRAQYPDEMTIVLQYQFYDLTVDQEKFSVALSFSGVPHKLSIPLAAITTFADPSVNFALQFQSMELDEEEDFEPEAESDDDAETKAEEPPKMGQVVALDAFRKKQQ